MPTNDESSFRYIGTEISATLSPVEDDTITSPRNACFVLTAPDSIPYMQSCLYFDLVVCHRVLPYTYLRWEVRT